MRKKFLCSILFLFLTITKVQAYDHELTVTAIFRNDARFLKEWIEYHRIVGVEHFYLFNNLSDDDYQSVLQPYIDEGIVELIDWPHSYELYKNWVSIQTRAYTRAILKLKRKTKWLAIIDTDEFLVPVKENDLPTVLKKYEKYGGVAVNWQMFGTSNVQHIPDDQLMTEHLVMRAPKNYSDNHYVKCIVRPTRTRYCPSPHYVTHSNSHYTVNENKKKVKGKLSKNVTVNQLRINHYWTRDEDFFEKVKLARMIYLQDDIPKQYRRKEEMNQMFDDTILRFIPELKRRMFATTEGGAE